MPPDRGRRPRTLAGVISAAWPVPSASATAQQQVSGIRPRIRRLRSPLPAVPWRLTTRT